LLRENDEQNAELKRCFGSDFKNSFRKVYFSLTESERMNPLAVKRRRTEEIAEATGLDPRLIRLLLGTLCALMERSRQLTLDDVVHDSQRFFTREALEILRRSGRLGLEIGEEFVDSFHWLWSLRRFGSAVVLEKLDHLGLHEQSLINARRSLEGRMDPLPGPAPVGPTPLSNDGESVYRHLLSVYHSGNQHPLTERELAVAMMKDGDSTAAAVLAALGVDLSQYAKNMLDVLQ
jgi:hypothetical protein